MNSNTMNNTMYTLVTIGTLLVLVAIILGVAKRAQNKRHEMTAEHMAPLGWGSYKNTTYPVGGCDIGTLERSDCEVGNCPLGSTVSDERFCGIQCAQDPDVKTRAECYNDCMGMMKNC